MAVFIQDLTHLQDIFRINNRFELWPRVIYPRFRRRLNKKSVLISVEVDNPDCADKKSLTAW